jgi:hypothetical protein
MSSENVTVRERIILHLDRFPKMGPEELYNVPFDLTQDGIASITGISRAHASLELKKLEEHNKVGNWLAHIKSSGSKRKAYYLLPDGKMEAELLRNRFESSGMMVDTLLDMKRCDPTVMWETLSPKDRETFGRACVFRVPVPRRSLPDTSTGVIPAGFDGSIQISESVRDRYLSVVDLEKVRTWHSQASDWWMDGGDDQERLYHLVKAHRNIDACKLLIRNSEGFLENPNEDLLTIVSGMIAPPKFTESIYSIRAHLALDCGDAKNALVCADILDDFGTTEPALIRAEADLVSGNPERAFDSASQVFDEKESSRAALIAAKALLALGRYDDAASFLNSAYETLTDNRDGSRMDEIMMLKAGIAYSRGRSDESLSYLGKALRACRKDRRRDRIDALSDGIRKGRGDLDFF